MLVKALLAEGVEIVFGYPGGANMPIYDALFGARDRLRHVLVRHEQGAGHAAEGYARATGRPGVCMGTSGPGATNLLTALADALMDSTPLVAVTGQVASAKLGTDAFQEADAVGMSLPATRWAWQIANPAEIPWAVRMAFRRRLRRHRGTGPRVPGPQARAGAPRHHPRCAERSGNGPLPGSRRPPPRTGAARPAPHRAGRPTRRRFGLRNDPPCPAHPAAERRPSPRPVRRTGPRAAHPPAGGRHPDRRGLIERCEAAVRLLNRAERPYVLAGQGVTIAGAEAELREVAERGRIPVGLTLLGLSALPSNHPLNVGLLGMHGNYGANLLTNEADVILAVGMRFDDRVTGNLDSYARQARIIHIDIDSAEINKAVSGRCAHRGRRARRALGSCLPGPRPGARERSSGGLAGAFPRARRTRARGGHRRGARRRLAELRRARWYMLSAGRAAARR